MTQSGAHGAAAASGMRPSDESDESALGPLRESGTPSGRTGFRRPVWRGRPCHPAQYARHEAVSPCRHWREAPKRRYQRCWHSRIASARSLPAALATAC